MAEPKGYRITLTPTAKAAYRNLAQAAALQVRSGNFEHSAVKSLRIVDECLDSIIPHDPLAKSRALSGPLSNIFRVKKGRMRICYVASSAKREIVILYISDTLRKQGDKNDPYEVFSRLVMSGEYADIFQLLGIKPVPRKGA